MNEQTIDHATLVKLVKAGTVHAARVVGHAGGWGVVVSCGKTARALAAQRGGKRLFAKLDTVATYLRSIGVDCFDVAVAQYKSRPARRSRPDRAHALKHLHQAAAYDKWFRAEVQASLDDPRSSIPNEQVAQRWAKKRVQLLKKARTQQRAKG